MIEKVRTILQNPKFELDPDFDALGAKLKGGKDVRDDWETNLGSFALSYFESFLDVLEREKFAEDELLREGLEEGVPKGVVHLRIVDELKEGYNEILLDDGALVIQVIFRSRNFLGRDANSLQTTPDKWGTNINYAAQKLVDIL